MTASSADNVEKRRGKFDLAKGDESGPLGEEGGLPQTGPLRQFKILIPLESDEMGDPGKGAVVERKG